MGIWRRLPFWLALVVLAALTSWLYRPLIKPIGFAGDNAENFRDTVDRDTPATIFDPFLITTSLGANTYYCPTQSIVWLGLAKLFTPGAIYYRVFALLVHLTCGLLAAALARSLLSSDLWGAAAGAFFLFFAYHVSTINFVSAVITHGLCVAFYLATLLAFAAYLRSRKIIYYFSALAFFVLAHLSKETAWSLLPVMLALEYAWFLHPEQRRPTFLNLTTFVNKYWPFAFVLLGAMTVFLLKYPYGNISHSWGGASVSINVLFRFFDLLRLLLIPKWNEVWLNLAALNFCIFGLVAAAAFGSARLRWVLLWIALAILPFCFSNFRPTEAALRYLYLPSVPLALLLAYAAQWSRQRSAVWRIPLSALPLVLIVFNAWLIYEGLPR